MAILRTYYFSAVYYVFYSSVRIQFTGAERDLRWMVAADEIGDVQSGDRSRL